MAVPSPSPRRILLLSNRRAGGFRPRTLKSLRRALERAGHQVAEGDSHDRDLSDLARACDHVCIVGGDGTVRDVLHGLGEQAANLSFSVYPLGTINLIAREAGYGRAIADFVERVGAAGEGRVHHFALLNSGTFLACASVGPDSMAVARLSPQLKGRIGRLAYLVAFLGVLIDWPRHLYRVTVDGQSHECEAAYLLKGRYYAGPWSLCAGADLCRPSCEILLLPRARRRDFLRLAVSAILGDRFADPAWIRLSGGDIHIDGRIDGAGDPVQADGDIVDHLPAHIRVADRGIRFA